jgi:hypothetical protein
MYQDVFKCGLTHFGPYLVHIEISKTSYNSERREYFANLTLHSSFVIIKDIIVTLVIKQLFFFVVQYVFGSYKFPYACTFLFRLQIVNAMLVHH